MVGTAEHLNFRGKFRITLRASWFMLLNSNKLNPSKEIINPFQLAQTGSSASLFPIATAKSLLTFPDQKHPFSEQQETSHPQQQTAQSNPHRNRNNQGFPLTPQLSLFLKFANPLLFGCQYACSG
ncbi:hypothetical protein Droror1_Dr00000343 [Drosera rotundifolia]